MRIVLDTNILVSGLLSPFGAPAEILRLVSSGAVTLCFDARILSEYDEVLRRARFAFDSDAVRALLDLIVAEGHLVSARPLSRRLPDPDDEAFLEVAIAGAARCLVTGNLKHYPAAGRQGMAVLPPAAFVDLCRNQA